MVILTFGIALDTLSQKSIFTLYIYIYIYMCVCACVCACVFNFTGTWDGLILFFSGKQEKLIIK